MTPDEIARIERLAEERAVLITLERMWLLPARSPGEWVWAEHARLRREQRCVVCRLLVAGKDRWVTAGLVIHRESGWRIQPCYVRLVAEGRDRSRSRAGRWRPKDEILARLAARWVAEDEKP